MGILVRVWISPLALGALVLGAMLGLRAAWWQVLIAVIVAAVCGILAVGGAFALARWIERRDEHRWQQRYAREMPAAVAAAVMPQAAHPDIAPAPQVTVNFYGVRPSEVAAVIRAIPGTAITEGDEHRWASTSPTSPASPAPPATMPGS